MLENSEQVYGDILGLIFGKTVIES